MGQKVWKSLETFGIFEKFGICSIPNFPKITKNDVKLEIQKSQKKLVPTWKPTWMFVLKFGMQGLS